MVVDGNRDKSLVKDLMELKEKLDQTISDCFENNEKFIQGQRDAFNYFINVRANKPAELIGINTLDSSILSSFSQIHGFQTSIGQQRMLGG